MTNKPNFGERILALDYTTNPAPVLPKGIRIMNPFSENPQAMSAANAFYRKYYSDNETRVLILGINPGRFGAGLTGIPFTDPKRLVSECHIAYNGQPAHEPSSVFIYEMINAFGSVEAFYKKFYISSMFPLAFVKADEAGREKNYNYYDSPDLFRSVRQLIVENIWKQIALGVRRDACICLGTGKNETHLRMLNAEYQFFERIVALEHPRFIMQYKSATKEMYIEKYLRELNEL